MIRERYKRYLAEVDECIAAAREGIALQQARLELIDPKRYEAVRERLAWSEDALRQIVESHAFIAW